MSRGEALTEFSAGGVVYRQADSDYEIAAVRRPRHNDWSLPKGRIEPGETREQAAVREVREETGLDASIIEPLEEVVYFYRRRGHGLVRKTVYHYLLRAAGHKLGGPNWEVAEVRWVPISEAQALLTYENDRGVVEKARAALERGGSAESPPAVS